MKKRTVEKGQIIVILALSLVAILGITALAVDGTLLYNQRRFDQNAADSAALAGAGKAAEVLENYNPNDFSCGPGSTSVARQASDAAVDAAEAIARDEYGITLDRYDLSNKNGVTVDCNSDSEFAFLDIHVMVHSDPETNFARVLSINTLQTTVEAITRVYPTQPFAYGNALVSLSDICKPNQGGIMFLGNSTTFINKGGIFSNSCVEAGGTSTIDVVGGSVSAFLPDGCDNYEPKYTLYPPVSCQKAPSKLPKGMLPPPQCPERSESYVDTDGSFGGTQTLPPGWYDAGITIKNKAYITLSPGLYCIHGGMRNNAQSYLKGNNVTLYFLDDAAVTLNQNTGENTGTDLSAPSCDTSACGVPHAVQGLLMYFATGESAQVTLNGGSNNEYVGTIYGEDTNFTLNGGTETYTFNTQIIGNYIYVSGGAQLMMDLNNKQWVQRPASLSLIK